VTIDLCLDLSVAEPGQHFSPLGEPRARSNCQALVGGTENSSTRLSSEESPSISSMQEATGAPAQIDQLNQTDWLHVQEAARPSHRLPRAGWRRGGRRSRRQGVPALLGTLGSSHRGRSLWRSYRTTVRLYTDNSPQEQAGGLDGACPRMRTATSSPAFGKADFPVIRKRRGITLGVSARSPARPRRSFCSWPILMSSSSAGSCSGTAATCRSGSPACALRRHGQPSS